jgi:hypothetical protein
MRAVEEKTTRPRQLVKKSVMGRSTCHNEQIAKFEAFVALG